MKHRLFLALAIGISCTSVSRAQSGPDNDPDAAPGFVNSVFHQGHVDSVNLYNGQLTIPIALGPSYPVGPSLKFQAALTFNSRATDYGQPTGQVPDYVYQPLAGNPALGLGWEFTLGAIKFCKAGSTAGLCYFGPDGGQHIFSQGARTGDGSRLTLSGAGPYDMWDGEGNHYVFGWQVSGLDDRLGTNPGYIHDFGMGRDGWYLTSVTDPFGNSYSVGYYTVVPPCWNYGSPSAPCTLGPTMTCPTAPVKTWIPQSVFLPTATVQVLLATEGTTPNMIGGFLFPVSGGATSFWALDYEQAWDNFHPCSSYFISLPVEVQRLRGIELPSELGGSPSYRFSNACPFTMTVPTGASISYEFGLYTFFHGRAGATVPNCGGMTPQNVQYVEVSAPGGGCPTSAPSRPQAPNSAISPTCSLDNEARWVDTASGVVRRTETIPGSGSDPALVAVTDYTQYSFPYGEGGSITGKLDAQTLTVTLSPADVDGRRRASAVLFRSTPRPIGPSGTLFHAPGDRVGADLEERAFDGDPNTASPIATSAPACSGGAADQPFCASRAVRAVARAYEYDDCNADGLAGGTVCHEIGNRRLKAETTCYGSSGAGGSCLSGLSHTVAFSNLPGRDWDFANGRHYNVEQHSGSLGNDGRTITTYWTPSVTPWLPNLFDRRTDAMGSSTVDHYFEHTPSNGFPRGDFVYDAGRQMVFLTCRYNDGAGNVGQDFSATYPGQSSAPPSNACSLAYPTFPTVGVGVNGDAFGKIYTHRNGLLLSARWMADPSTPAAWSVKNLFRDSTTGWILASSDPSGLTTGYTYDSLGRVKSISPPGEAATVISYDTTTQTTATRNGGSGLSTLQQYLYDGLGRLSREIRLVPSTSASPYAVRLTRYDTAGNPVFASEWTGCSSPAACASSSPAAGTNTSNFDPLERPQTLRNADGATVSISYADGSSPASVTQKSVTANNINGNCSAGCVGGTSVSTTYRYDAFGRLTSLTEPGGNDVTSYSYDVNGKLTQVSQGVQTRTFSYDSAGFLRSENTPEKGTVTYDAYGSLGNVLSETDPGGLAVSRTYDFAGRLTGIVSGGQRFRTDCYDGQVCADGNPGYAGGAHPLGKLTRRIGFNPQSPSTPIVTDDMTYSDAAGRLSSQTTTVAGARNLSSSQQWQYNGLGLVAHHRHARQAGDAPFAVSTDYDGGLPSAEYVNGIPMVTAVRYQPSGSLWSYTSGIGIGRDVTTSILQDATSRLPRPSRILTMPQTGSSPLFDTLGYTYDGAGNITEIGADSFSYDSRSRLSSANLSGAGGQSYSYDRYGNLLSKAGNVFCSTTCANNQLAGASYVRGNLTGYAGQTFTWDGLDRMISNQSASLLWSYVYDGGGERIAKIPPTGSWLYTIRDERKRAATEYSDTAVSRDNVFLGNSLVLSYANAAVGGSGPVWTFYASDHLGTPRLVTDIAGNTVETRRYWPYGDAIPAQASFETLRFAAMEFDAEGGTGPGLASDRYYDHARSHVGGLGRFLSPDSLYGASQDAQGWNRYSYAGSNPLKFVDPNGEEKYWAEAFASSVIGVGSSMQSAGASLNQGGPIGITADFLVSTAGSMVQGTGDMFNLGVSTGEAIGAGEDSFKTTLAISQDVGRLGAWALTVAGAGAAEARIGGSELVQRAMSNAELQATRESGLIRGGREGTHFVSDAVNSDALRARQRLALYKTPEARATLEVKKGVFGKTRIVRPANKMPGGGTERTAEGKVKVKIVDELQY